MPSISWRRALRTLVTVKRNTTATSDTGATRFVYATVAEHVRCSMQDAGGRLRQDDLGQVAGRKKSVTFGPEADVQQNDLIVVEGGGGVPTGLTFRITHFHQSIDNGGTIHHQESLAEQWVPSGEL